MQPEYCSFRPEPEHPWHWLMIPDMESQSEIVPPDENKSTRHKLYTNKENIS
jgi:hypothetical protein